MGALHVKGSFQLDNVTSSAPAAADCNSLTAGRMQIVTSGPGTFLYLCSGSAWKSAQFK